MFIIERMRKKRPGPSGAAAPAGEPPASPADRIEESKLKLEKKRAKAEAKKAKKESNG